MTNPTDANETQLGKLRAKAQRSFAAFRGQIDKTGLFPDLTGAAGKALRQTVRDDGQITKAYMLMCGLSAGIAALGLLQSSTAVVIGAMLISPLMGPIASMGFGFASFDGRQIRASVKVITVGAAIGILTGILLTWLSPINYATPEIIARTEPTLLDLAVAIFSGIAGAYATVQQKGATAIGVAIATALMPPLATVGYGLGVGNPTFALGAFLLFLTNLAAIAFSFALVARLSGAARPISNVEVTPRYLIAGVSAFMVLATPLGVTLYRVTAEAKAQATVRRLLLEELDLRSVNIAQLQVKWPLRGTPSVDAVVVSPRYSNDAERRLLASLEATWGVRPALNLQQVIAADLESQTRAIVDAAVETSAAGITRDVPPLIAIREAIGLPTQALWVNRAERTVQIVPFAAQGWEIQDYRNAEVAATAVGSGWTVRIIPPVQPRLTVAIEMSGGLPISNQSLENALWAIERWGVQGITVTGFSDQGQDETKALSDFAVAALARVGIRATASGDARVGLDDLPRTTTGVSFEIVRRPVRREEQ